MTYNVFGGTLNLAQLHGYSSWNVILYMQSVVRFQSGANTGAESQFWGKHRHSTASRPFTAVRQQHARHTYNDRCQRPGRLLAQLVRAAHTQRSAGCTGTQRSDHWLVTAHRHPQWRCYHVGSCTFPCCRRSIEAHQTATP